MILEVFSQPYQFCEKKIVLRGGLQQFTLVLPIGRGSGYRSHQSGEAKAGIRTGKVLVNLEQGAMKGEVTGAVKHLQTEGVWVCPPCPRGWGKKERALGEAPRFSLEVNKHFPWGETEQTAWRGNEGFWLHVRQISASKIQVTLPWGRGMDRWLLDILSSLVFL